MTPPLMGTRDVLILAARPFSIHGDVYLELTVEGDEGQATLRVPRHAWTTAGSSAASSVDPAAGDRVRLTFLMGQVTRVEVL